MSTGPGRLALVVGASVTTLVVAAGVAVASSESVREEFAAIPERCVEALGGSGSPDRTPLDELTPGPGDYTLQPGEIDPFGNGGGLGDGDGLGEGDGQGDGQGPGDQPTGVPTPAEPLPVPPPEEIKETAEEQETESASLPTLLVALLVAVLLAVLAFVLSRMWRRPATPDADDPFADPEVTAAQAQERAVAAEKVADHDAALRWTFVQGLVRLGTAGVLDYDPTRPTGEVARVLRSLRFDGLATMFDTVAYGRRRATADDVRAARDDWERLLAEQAATGRPA